MPSSPVNTANPPLNCPSAFCVRAGTSPKMDTKLFFFIRLSFDLVIVIAGYFILFIIAKLIFI